MRESPRTWPSIRCSRLRADVLISLRMRSMYPQGVRVSRAAAMSMQTGERHAPAASDRARDLAPAAGGADTLDPVCGMRVDPATARQRHAHLARTYYFCSDRCRG